MATPNWPDLFGQLSSILRQPLLTRHMSELLKKLFGGAVGVTFTIGAEAANAIVVSLQFKDEVGNEIDEVQSVKILILANAAGTALNTNNYTIAAGTDGAVTEVVADKVLECTTEADGDLDISLTLTGAGTCYLGVVGPTGKLTISSAITHAA